MAAGPQGPRAAAGYLRRQLRETSEPAWRSAHRSKGQLKALETPAHIQRHTITLEDHRTLPCTELVAQRRHESRQGPLSNLSVTPVRFVSDPCAICQ